MELGEIERLRKALPQIAALATTHLAVPPPCGARQITSYCLQASFISIQYPSGSRK